MWKGQRTAGRRGVLGQDQTGFASSRCDGWRDGRSQGMPPPSQAMLLRILMTICSLGAEWCDSSKIPVDEIVEEWRSRSAKGRYEHAMWKAAGLEEPTGCWQQQEEGGAATWRGDEDGSRAFEGMDAMLNLRAHPQWSRAIEL